MNKIFTIFFTLTFLVLGNLNAQVIYSEDFEGGSLPADWIVNTISIDEDGM